MVKTGDNLKKMDTPIVHDLKKGTSTYGLRESARDTLRRYTDFVRARNAAEIKNQANAKPTPSDCPIISPTPASMRNMKARRPIMASAPVYSQASHGRIVHAVQPQKVPLQLDDSRIWEPMDPTKIK